MMMLNDDFMRQLMATFAIEAQEQIQAINKHLLALEKGPDPKTKTWLWAEIFREAHSLKGAARAVNLQKVNDLAHAVETLFGQLQSHKLEQTPEMFDLMYQVMDSIQRLIDAVTAGQDSDVDVDVDTHALLAKVEAVLVNQPAMSIVPARPHKMALANNQGAWGIADKRAAGDIGDIGKPKTRKNGRGSDSEMRRHRDGAKKRSHNESQISPAKRTSASSAAIPANEKQPAQKKIPDSATTPIISVNMGQTKAIGSKPEMLPTSVNETVRVTTTKLDALMAQVSELQVMRIGTEQRLVELAEVLAEVEGWEREWRKIQPYHRRLLFQQGKQKGTMPWAQIQRAGVKPLMQFFSTNETNLKKIRGQLNQLQRKLKADHHQIRQVLTHLQEDVRRTRMEPIATLFDSFSRMVRDLAREQGKKIEFLIEGRETEVDRTLIQQIKAPLVHLLRNAIDHGLETAEERQMAGKSAQGDLTLSATQQGHHIVIQICDNGRGILPDKVKASAIKKGILKTEEAAHMDDKEALWLIFRSGFSTSPIITDLSGRGVGLDVVRESIERMQGMIEVSSQPNQGTSFTITWPLTVAAMPALLVRATGQPFAIPITNVARLVHFNPDEIRQAEGHRVIRVDGRPVPLVPLAEVLQLGLPTYPSTVNQPAVVLGSAERRVAFLVDHLIGTQDVVIKSLPYPFLRVKHIAGATILGSGEVVNILHVGDLIRTVKWPGTQQASSANGQQSRQALQSKRKRPIHIVVADDSMTTRMMEKNILEVAGYQVEVVADGKQALRELQRGAYDLLVSDVEMPHINGFDLTAQIRADQRLKNLPIILVTSLNSPQDRQRGIKVGADAYIAKGSFEENHLLHTVKRLVG